ncbi:MAG: MBL fold metallo-hydrolase [Acutalibacter sp.]|nr:MBL fold metallo-hydrolase [Acutalibacter sp.]
MATENSNSEVKMSETAKRFEKRQQIRRICLWVLAAVLVASCTAPGRQFWQRMFRLSEFGGRIDAPLSIHVLDVGKADAILIECDGHAALLDAGTDAYGETVVDYMYRHDMEALDYAIVSHPDKDHLGGMAQVLSEVDTDTLVRAPYFEEKYEAVLDIARERTIADHIVRPGESIPLGEAVLRVLAPLKEYEDTNNGSLVIRLEYRGFTVLFCGDIEKEAERDLADAYGELLSADILKVPHHGSKTSCTKRFLQVVSPQYAVVSVGRDSNNLPSEKVLQRLDDYCHEVYRTDSDGTVIFTFDGTGMKILTKQ